MRYVLIVLSALALMYSCSSMSTSSKAAVTPPAPQKPPMTLKVNLSSTIRPATHCASGSLYGITQDIPYSIAKLVAPLRPNVFTAPARSGAGYQQPYGAAIPVAGRLESTTGRVMIRLADICPNWPYEFPGMSSWLKDVASVIKDKKASGYTDFYGYEIWNEPNYTWNYANGTFYNLWQKTYALIRSLDPKAKIIGPSSGFYNYDRMRDFLNFCKENNCLPDIISWHELASAGGTGASTVTVDIDSMRALEKKVGVPNLPISINEYCDANHWNEGAPGAMAPFIAKFERLGVDSACISWWWTAFPGRLGSLLATNTEKGGGWWFYHWYGSMTGSMVSVTPPNDESSDVDGFANIDPKEHYASLCFGGNNYGTLRVVINGIPSWFGGAVRVIFEQVSWVSKDQPVPSTDLVSQSIKTVSNGSINLTFNGLYSLYGYRILLIPSAPSAATLLPGHTYKLLNVNSGKFLEVSDKGTGINQWGDTGTSKQDWAISSAGAYYRVANVSNGKVLGISNGAAKDKTQVVQSANTKSADNDWTFTDTGAGIYKIVNKSSGKSLGIQAMSSLDGADAVQSSDSKTADHLWALVLVK